MNCLNFTLKLTLKQFRHISVYLHRHQRASTTNIKNDKLLTNKLGNNLYPHRAQQQISLKANKEIPYTATSQLQHMVTTDFNKRNTTRGKLTYAFILYKRS